MQKENILLLVDLNGTMGYRTETRVEGFRAPRLNNKYFYVRPDAINFLKSMSKHFKLCIVTSVMQHNAEKLLNLVDRNWKNYITFLYSREYNKIDSEGEKEFDTIRDFDKIFFHSKHGFENTILIDNEKRKLRESPDNGLIVPEFGENQVRSGEKNTLDSLSEYLVQLEKEYSRKNFDVREYMKQNPFNVLVDDEESLSEELITEIEKIDLNQIESLDFSKFGSVEMIQLEKDPVLLYVDYSGKGFTVEISDCKEILEKRLSLADLIFKGGNSTKIKKSKKPISFCLEKCENYLNSNKN